MQDNETKKWLYDSMKSKGYDLGSYEEFDAHADEEETRKWLYDNGVKSGLELGSYEEFDAGMGKNIVSSSPEMEGSTSKAGPKAQEVVDEYDSFKRMNAQNRMQELMRKQDNEPKPRKTLQDIVSESSTPVEQNILNREPISREPAYTKGEERNYRPDIFERMKYDSSIRDEDAAVDKEYTPKVEEKEEDVFENYRNRFGLTQRGAELQEELVQIQSDLQNKYSKEFENTPEYKAIVGKKYNTQEEIDAANKALNDAYNKKYGAVINKEMEPYLKAYEGEIFQRYAPRIQEGLRTVAKNDTSKEVKALTGEVDELLEKQHKILRSKGPSSGNAMSALMGSRAYNQSTAKERQELGALEASQRLLEQSQEIIEEAGKKGNTNFFAGLGRGFRDNMDIENFTFGLSEMADSKYLNRALEKAEKGEKLTPAEEKLLEASVVNMATYGYFSSDLGRGYGAGSTTAVSLPFMLEFIANPISGSGNAIAKGLLKFGLKKFGRASAQTASKGALNAFGRGIASNTGKFAGRLAGDAAAALGMEGTTGLGRVAAGTLDRLNENYDYSLDDNGQLQVRKTGNTSIGGAFARSAASTFFENQSEMVFNAFRGWSPFMKAVDKALPGRMNEFLNRIKNSKPGQLYRELKNNPTFREIVERAQFHGQGEEYLEEVYNNLANVAMGEMTMEDALDLDNNIDTFLGLAPTSVMFGLFGLGGMAADRYSNRRKMRALFEKMTPEQQAKLTELTQMSKERGNEDIKKFIEITIADKNLTTEQKKDEIEYAFELAKQNAIEDLQQEQTPEGRAADDAYVQGTELPVEQRYSAEQERVAAEEALREIDENALNTIDRMLADDASANEIEEIISGMDEDSAKLARDYYNKSMRINGIVDSARDDAEEAVASFEASLQEAIIPDAEGNGTITTATLMSGAGEVKEEVYVIANDGVQATILQKDGTKKMVNSGLLDNMQTSLANDVVQLYQDRIGEQMRDQTDMSLNHHPKTRVPQPGMQIWNGDMSLIITEVNADGSVRAFPAVLNNKTGLMEPKNGSTPVDMSAKESLDLQDDYYNKMDAASIGINVSEKEGENAIVSRDEESKVSGKEAVQISEGRNISEEDMFGRGLTEDEAGKFVMDMELNAETVPEIELTPENWIAEFGSEGILSTPLGNVKMGNNQYLKLSQQGRNGKLGMIKPTLTNPDVIIEDESRARNGEQERDSSYVFVKAFTDKNGKRVYYFTSVTVKKGGNEVVISNQEKGIKRISKLLQNGKVAWIKPYDSLHPTSQEEKPVSLDETNGPTSNGNQPALLGINSPVVSENKDTQKSSENQEVNVNNSIQFDEKGNPLYHKAPVETTVAYLSDGSLTDEEIDLIVAANQAEANKQLEKIIKDTPKIVTNKEKYVAAKKAWQAKVDDARQQSEYWKEVASFIKQQREQPGDKITEEILSMGEPLNELELAAQKLANGSLPLLYEDYKRELGFSNEEVGKMFGLFKSRENGGLTIEEAGEVLMQNDLKEGSNFFDQEDANAGRNAILEVLSSARTRGDLIEYIRKKREAASERERRSEEEYDENQRDAWYEEHYGMSYADYVTFEEVINDIIQEKALSKEAIQEFYDNFADEFNNWNNGRITEETTFNERGAVDSRSESSEGLLPTEQLSDNRGIETDISAEADERADNKGVPASEKSIITEIETAREQVDTNPSDAQKEAGNYKKGHIKLDGYDITIENPKGSERSGKDADGNKWSITMNNDYGYIRGTESIDGDHIDIFLSDNPAEGNVYVIDQLNTTTGEFDEHKVMYGFSSMDEATQAYLSNYSPGWQGLGAISEVSKDEFKKWIDSSHRKTKPFADYKSVKVEESQNQGKTEVKLPQSKSNAKNKKRAADIKQARYELMDAKRELSVAQATNSGYTPEEVEEKKKRVEEAESKLKDLTNKVPDKEVSQNTDRIGKKGEQNLIHQDLIKSIYVKSLADMNESLKNIKENIKNEQEKEEPNSDLLEKLNIDKSALDRKIKRTKSVINKKVSIMSEGEFMLMNIINKNQSLPFSQMSENDVLNSVDENEINDILDKYSDYIKELSDNGVLQKEFNEASIQDEINIRNAIESSGYEVEDLLDTSEKKKSQKKKGEEERIRKSEELMKKLGIYDESARFREIEDVNRKFNEDLQKQIDGTLPEGHIYQLGMPSEILKSTGIPDYPIQLSAKRLIDKATKFNHDFSLLDIKNIVEAVQNPIAIFKYGNEKKAQNLVIELQSEDKNFIIGLSINPTINGNELHINSIRNVFPKDNAEWLNWIMQEKLLRVDKERIQNLINKQRTNLADVAYLDLDSITKIVENFENPTIEEGKIVFSVDEMSDKLNTPIHIARSLNEIPDGSAKRAIEEGRKVKAWFDTGTREVFFYIPNATDVNDAKVSILHEVVGHKGLRNLFGTENEMEFDSIMMDLFEKLPLDVRSEIADMAVSRYASNVSVAMDEYLAEQAEKDETPGWWDRVVSAIRDFFRKMGVDVKLSENDVKYLLWRSRKKLETGDLFEQAKDVVMRNKLGIGLNETQETSESAPTESTRFRIVGGIFDSAGKDVEVVERETGNAREMYDRTLQTAGYKRKESWQDSMLGLKEAQDAIAKATHSRILDYENAYMAENALSSRSLAEINAYRELVYKPILEEIAQMKKQGAKYEDISDYLITKHGIERNREMAVRKALAEDEDTVKENIERWTEDKKNIWNNGSMSWKEKQEELDRIATSYGADMSVDYSGLSAMFPNDDMAETTAEAYKAVEGFEEKFETAPLLDKVKAATTATLDKQRDSGLMNKDTYKSIQDMYQFYVPLRGWEEKTADEVYDYITSETPVFNAPLKTAKGRTSKSDDPLPTIANIAESGILQGNRNLMKQKFLTMVENHRSNLVSVSELWVKYDAVNDKWIAIFPEIPNNASAEEVENIVSQFNARMEELSKNNPDEYKKASDARDIPYKILPKDLKEHQVIVKRNGKEYVLTINGNPRAAQALNGLTNPNATNSPIIKLFESTNRFLAANFTQRNPAFVISNMFRDGFYSNSVIWVKESPLYAKKYNKNWAKSFKEMGGLVKRYKTNSLDMNNDTDRMFLEFINNGGETGYTFINSVEEYKGIIAKELKKQNRSKLAPGTAFDILGEAMDTFGRWAEDTSRFAAYRTSREMGRSIARSISDAKEISVNFNKKGSGAKTAGQWEKGNRLNFFQAWTSQTARGLYIFWNAGVQGLTNFARLAKRNPGKFAGLASSYFVLGTMMPIINAAIASAMGGDGDEDDYYNLPEYVRRNNICIYVGGEWITMPLPIELRAIYGLGELASGLLSGKENMTGWKLTKKIAEQVSQIMPIDMMEGGGGFSAFVPSYVKPAYEVWTNKDWTGIPIYRKNDFNKNMPEWTKAYSSTSPELVKLSEIINEWTGGTKYKTGMIDFNPAIVEHLFESYLGGVGTTINQLKKTLMMPFNEDLQELRNAPVISRFMRSADSRSVQKRIDEEYFNNRNRFELIQQEVNGYKKELNNPQTNDFDYAKYQTLYNKMINSDEYRKYIEFKEMDEVLKRMRDAFKQSGNEELEAQMFLLKEAMNEVAK